MFEIFWSDVSSQLVLTHLLHLVSEDLPAVVVAQSAARHYPGHPLAGEEDRGEVDHGLLERLVTRDLRLSLEEALRIMKIFTERKVKLKFDFYLNFSSESLQTFLGKFVVPLGHVIRLLGVERIGDTAEDEHVELNSLLPVLLVLLLLLQQLLPGEGLLAGEGGGGRPGPGPLDAAVHGAGGGGPHPGRHSVLLDWLEEGSGGTVLLVLLLTGARL